MRWTSRKGARNSVQSWEEGKMCLFRSTSIISSDAADDADAAGNSIELGCRNLVMLSYPSFSTTLFCWGNVVRLHLQAHTLNLGKWVGKEFSMCLLCKWWLLRSGPLLRLSVCVLSFCLLFFLHCLSVCFMSVHRVPSSSWALLSSTVLFSLLLFG